MPLLRNGFISPLVQYTLMRQRHFPLLRGGESLTSMKRAFVAQVTLKSISEHSKKKSSLRLSRSLVKIS